MKRAYVTMTVLLVCQKTLSLRSVIGSASNGKPRQASRKVVGKFVKHRQLLIEGDSGSRMLIEGGVDDL